MQNFAMCVYTDPKLANYHFGESHPFGPLRHDAFAKEFFKRKLNEKVQMGKAEPLHEELLRLFHTEEYIQLVKEKSKTGSGYLDRGDTPAVKGIYETSCYVVGTVIHAIDSIMENRFKRAFIPIAGLHHARRNRAGGFCVFNDCGIAIEYLKQKYKLRSIAYVDIDAHHGDGVFYEFESDPAVVFADMHEDGNYLYPGTGAADETGTGAGKGFKLNIPMPPGANDNLFFQQWEKVESFLLQKNPEFIILQCGADSIHGDPITHMAYSEKAHAYAAKKLREMAEKRRSGYPVSGIHTWWRFGTNQNQGQPLRFCTGTLSGKIYT